MAGRPASGKSGRDDAATRSSGAVASIFVPRRISPLFGRGGLDRGRDDPRLDRPELVSEGGYRALPL
jgi:hypothetical protein